MTASVWAFIISLLVLIITEQVDKFTRTDRASDVCAVISVLAFSVLVASLLWLFAHLWLRYTLVSV